MLKDLKEIGYQVGCGFMVGSPYQTSETLAMDLKFIETFKPDMCGIGPFISQKDTPFKNMESGTLNQTLFLLSLVFILYHSDRKSKVYFLYNMLSKYVDRTEYRKCVESEVLAIRNGTFYFLSAFLRREVIYVK